MFNVFDPKKVKRGKVPTQVLPPDEEIELLRGLADPFDKNVSPEMHLAAVEKLAQLGSGLVVNDWEVYVVQLPGLTHWTRHLVGRVGFSRNVLISPAILSINSKTEQFVTETGATFIVGPHMQGSPGCDSVWNDWKCKNGAVEHERITVEVRDALLSNRKRK
jgi:hypothetical protein